MSDASVLRGCWLTRLIIFFCALIIADSSRRFVTGRRYRLSRRDGDRRHRRGAESRTWQLSRAANASKRSFPTRRRRAYAKGATVVDARGLYAIPGLIDSHVHLATAPNRRYAEALLRRDVYSGVTAVRDMAGDARLLADLSRGGAARRNSGTGHRLCRADGRARIFQGSAHHRLRARRGRG